MLRLAVIGLIASVLASPALAQADPLDLFEATCFPNERGYDHQLRAARALGWSDDESHPVLAQAVANYRGIDRYTDVAGLTQVDALLLVAQGWGILVCTVILPGHTTPLNDLVFQDRFIPLRNSAYAPFNTIRQRFFSSPTDASQPADPILGERRPKIDIGLSGLVLTASSFTQ